MVINSKTPHFSGGLHGQISGFVGTGNMNVQVMNILSNSTLHVNQGNLSISVLEDPRYNFFFFFSFDVV